MQERSKDLERLEREAARSNPEGGLKVLHYALHDIEKDNLNLKKTLNCHYFLLNSSLFTMTSITSFFKFLDSLNFSNPLEIKAQC